MAKYFDIRKSVVDGMYRKWEERPLSSLRALEEDEINGPVWVVTGVFKKRYQVFQKEEVSS